MGRYSEVTRTARVKWCPGPELNRYVSFETRDFKSRASASFATRAGREVVEANISVRRMWTPGASLEAHATGHARCLFFLYVALCRLRLLKCECESYEGHECAQRISWNCNGRVGNSIPGVLRAMRGL